MGERDSSLVLALREWLPARAALLALLLLLGYIIAAWPLGSVALVITGAIATFLLLLYPEYGVVPLAFAVPFGTLKQVHLGSFSVGITDALVALMIASWLARVLATRRLSCEGAPLLLPLLGFMAAILLSLLTASSISESVVEIVKWLELTAVYLLVVTRVDRRMARILFLSFIAAGSMQALGGVYQFLFQAGPPEFMLYGRFMRASGTFGQPNPYAGYLGLTLPLALGVVIAGGPVWRREDRAEHRTSVVIWTLAAAATVLMGLALVMSWSRGAWLGFAAVAGTMSLARGRKWVARLLLAGLILISLLVALDLVHVLPSSVLERVGDLGTYVGSTDLSSVEVTDENWAVIERLAHWQAAIKMLDAHPVTGIGIGNYALVYPEYAIGRWQDPLGHAHNYYLHVGAEAGLIGLAAYLVLVGAWLWHAWRAVARTRGYWRGIALGALGVLVHLSVHNIFDNLYVHGMYVQVGMVLGLLSVAVPMWGENVSPAVDSRSDAGRGIASVGT